jgi:hypothetical protein
VNSPPMHANERKRWMRVVEDGEVWAQPTPY